MDSNVRISLFGGFRIEKDGRPILPSLRQSPKTRALIEYLIFKGGIPVSQDELVEALWEHGSGGANPYSALRTMLHRLRVAAEEAGAADFKKAIVTAKGAYRWDDSSCYVDLMRFEEIGKELQSPTITKNEKELLYKELISIYKGPLLPESSETRWISLRSISCHDLYINSVVAYIDLLKLDGRYAEICDICRTAMNIDVFDERLHTELIEALMHSGKNREALAQYYSSSDTMMKRFGAKPSDKSREAFKDIAWADLHITRELDSAAEELLAAESNAPLFCDFDLFKAVYAQQRRVCPRDRFILCGFSLGGNEVDPFKLDEERKLFEASAMQYLSESDTLSRYDTRRYLALIVGRDMEEAETVVSEIKAAFLSTSTLSLGVKSKLRAFDESPSNGEILKLQEKM